MRSITASRPSMTSVVAGLALFLSIGGTGYAAATISGKDLKKRSVPADRIVRNSLTGAQVNEKRLGIVPLSQRSLVADAAKLAESAKTAETAKSAETAQTAQSAKTADDAKTLNGRPPEAFMANSVRVVTAQSASIPNAAGTSVDATCAANEKAISGGAAWIIPGTDTPTQLDAPLTASLPNPATGEPNVMTGWTAVGRNTSGVPRVLRAYAVCVPKTA